VLREEDRFELADASLFSASSFHSGRTFTTDLSTRCLGLEESSCIGSCSTLVGPEQTSCMERCVSRRPFLSALTFLSRPMLSPSPSLALLLLSLSRRVRRSNGSHALRDSLLTTPKRTHFPRSRRRRRNSSRRLVPVSFRLSHSFLPSSTTRTDSTLPSCFRALSRICSLASKALLAGEQLPEKLPRKELEDFWKDKEKVQALS